MSPLLGDRAGKGRPILGRTRRVVLYAAVTLAFLLFQTSAVYALGLDSFRPDLVLVLVVYLGLKEHSIGGALGAFLIGYLLDTFSGSPVGTNALAMSIVFLFCYLASRRLWTDSVVSATLVVFLGCVLKSSVLAAVLGWGSAGGGRWMLARPVLTDWLAVMVLAPVLFELIDRVKRRLGTTE